MDISKWWNDIGNNGASIRSRHLLMGKKILKVWMIMNIYYKKIIFSVKNKFITFYNLCFLDEPNLYLFY